MGDWRFYVQRPGSGLWLDTNAQLDTPTLTWTLSGSDSGKAMIPAGSAVPTVAEDGRNVWGKMDTVLYAEENGNLSWAGICTSATPAKEGLQLEFAGTLGWLWGVPFFTTFSSWRVNTFDVIRALIANSRGYKPGFEFVVGNGMSAFTVGDPQPPPLPKQPPRRKKETKAEWTASARYKAWQKSVEAWNTSYSNYEKFEIAWHEAPMIGEIGRAHV